MLITKMSLILLISFIQLIKLYKIDFYKFIELLTKNETC